jgi:hypothetical protein
MVLPQSEVALYRAALRDVNTLAQRALLDVWRSFDFSDAKRVQDALTDELPGIIATHHGVAATVAADWYDLMRLESDVPGRFDAVVAEPPSLGRAVALAGWAVGPLFGAEPNPTIALSKLSGGLQRTVVNGARETITASSVADPRRPGWTRVGSGRCDYCRERIGLHIRSSEIFESHDACGCVAVPAF